MTWDPTQYERFARERSRPSHDLLTRIAKDDVRLGADLGCGTGELTRILAERWPNAEFTGVDSSPSMLERAVAHRLPGRLEFVLADLASWQPRAHLDLILSNAALHWVPNHERLLAKLWAALAPSGVLAVQMPGNHLAPPHRTVQDLASTPAFASKLGDLAAKMSPVQPLSWYVERFLGFGGAVDAWETTYIHNLQGERPVLEWIRGTMLRPYLERLDESERIRFEDELADRLARAFPPASGVTSFPFRRLFFVVTRGGS